MWKPIPGEENRYEVSDTGMVRSLDRTTISKVNAVRHFSGQLLKQRSDSSGYLIVRLTDKKNIRVGVLVLLAFIGARPFGFQCCHGDGNRRNNKLSNLRWGTRSDNGKDAVKHGTNFTPNTGRYGDKSFGPSKLIATDIERIDDLRLQGYTQRQIASWIGIGKSHIHNVVHRYAWPHLPIAATYPTPPCSRSAPRRT